LGRKIWRKKIKDKKRKKMEMKMKIRKENFKGEENEK